MVRLLRAIVALALLAPASALADYDRIGQGTFNDVNAMDQEVPYSSSSARQFDVSFDTSGYGIEPGESVAGNSTNACYKNPATHYSGRSGWVRFNPGVAGKIEVRAHTPTYDSIVYITESFGDSKPAWKSDTIADAQGPAFCSDETAGPGDEVTAF